MVNINSNPFQGSYPDRLKVFGNALFLSAWDTNLGYELWQVTTGPAFSVSAPSATISEGDSGSTTISFTVSLSEAVAEPTSVDWAVQGSGSNPADAADFVGNALASGSLSFAAGDTSKTIAVQVAGETVYEPDQTFQVVLSNAVGAPLAAAAATATIANDDPGLVISAASASKAEGNSGLTPFSFTVSRLGNSTGSAMVDWAVSGSGANPAQSSDFNNAALASGSLVFDPSETSKQITVQVAADTAVELNEQFSVTLNNATGAEIVTASASSTISNDDTSYSISADSASKPEGNSGTTAFTFTISRDGLTTGSGSVAWVAYGEGNSPANSLDINPSGVSLPSGSLDAGTVSFNPGETSKSVTISVRGDTTVELDERFRVSLSSPSNGLLAASGSSAAVTIDDDDFNGISLSLPGEGLLRFALPTNDPILTSFATNGLSDLVGKTGTAATLYGLSNVSVTITAVNAGVATVTGSGSLAGQSVSFSAQLAASSGALHALSSVSGTVDLANWLGSQAHFRNHSNGSLSLGGSATAPQFSLSGSADLLLDPDGLNQRPLTPIAVTISNVGYTSNAISSFTATPVELTPNLSLKLGEATLSLPRAPFTYARKADGTGYTLSLSGNGAVTMPDADALDIDALVRFGGSFGTGGSISVAPTRAKLEIVETNPFSVAGTQFTGIGGLNLAYQETSNRQYGLLSLNGSNKINLEQLRDVRVELGSSSFDSATALNTAASLLRPTGWTLGAINEQAGTTPASNGYLFDLGLARIKGLDIQTPTYSNRSTTSAVAPAASSDPDLQLAKALEGAGLFNLMPLTPTIQDRFTLLDLQGQPISEVVIDIAPSTTAQHSVTRYQQLATEEKYDLFVAAETLAKQEELGGIQYDTIFGAIADAVNTDGNVLQNKFEAFTDYFSTTTAAGSSPSLGTVSVNEDGEWTYTLDPTKLSDDQKLLLNNATSFKVTPRANVSTALKAELKDIDVTIANLLLGMKKQAGDALKFFGKLKPLVQAMEGEIPLSGVDFWGIKQGLLTLLQAVPSNAYKDDKLQVIELIDTAYYLTSNGMEQKRQKKIAEATGQDEKTGFQYPSITPFFKTLSGVIRTLEILAGKTVPKGMAGIDAVDLGLLFRSDLDPSDDYRWLYGATAEFDSTKSEFDQALQSLQTELSTNTTLSNRRDDASAFGKVDGNKVERGKFQGAVSKADTNIGLDLPPLYRPLQFVSDYLVKDRVTVFSLDSSFNLAAEGSVKIPIVPPLFGTVGMEGSLAIQFSLLSLLESEDLSRLSLDVNAIVASNKTDEQKQAEISQKVTKAFRDGLGTDLKKNKLSVTLEPYVGLVLGTPFVNLTGKLGVYFQYDLTSQRVVNGVAPFDQRIRFKDFYGDKPTGNYNYEPTLGSLRLDLNHNYDALLARNSLDTKRFGSFRDAYARNSWLLNLEFQPIFLKELIGESTVSYDKTLLTKLGETAIDRINWINLPGSNLVTERGVDLFFKDAKFLNSAASNALRTALQRQYPTLTAQELGRLLSLIVDKAVPTRISYALADAQDVQKRITELQSSTAVRSAGEVDSPIATGDRFRQRYLNDGKETAVDTYGYYSLAQPKYIDIKAKLVTNYASIEMDALSEGTNLELDLSFYDGSRWRSLGRVSDSLTDSRPASISQSNPFSPGIRLGYQQTAVAKTGEFVHNAGTVSLQLALVHMDGPGASSDEQILRRLASNGELKLRLVDSAESSSDVTFTAQPRIERGGAIYTKDISAGAVLQQGKAIPWSADLDSGTVQWLMPWNFQAAAARKDLAFLTSGNATTRSNGIYQNLNPQAPLALQLAVNQVEARSSTNLSASQSGTLANRVQGVMRFSTDPISGNTYKSYIGADGLVRIAVRSFDEQDWNDIATLPDLKLSPSETHAPDLVALGGQLVVASWNDLGALVTYRIDTAPTSGVSGNTPTATTTAVAISESLPAWVQLDPVLTATSGDNRNRFVSATAAAAGSNRDLQIGLEKRLDLSTGSSSLQKAFYLSLLDPIQQVYATSARPLQLRIDGYSSVANTQPLYSAAAAWADPAAVTPTVTTTALQGQLRALLGFGERSSKGVFSDKQPGSSLASVRAASFIEYASTDQLAAHLSEWGSGSLFVVVADGDGNAMVWNYDGDAYTRNNANRNAPEAVRSSGRVYNLDGMVPEAVSVVYKPTDQKDVLISNWAGLVDATTADYRQAVGTTLRSPSSHDQDDLVAGGNVALLVSGTARNLRQKVQISHSPAELGGELGGLYDYGDGTPVVRYFSSERLSDADGNYHWYDATNIAPLVVQAFNPTQLSQARQATARLNSGGQLGGLGWAWTTANPIARGNLRSLDTNTGLGFLDANSLNLAISGADLEGALGSDSTYALQPSSLQLQPTVQTPELFFSSQLNQNSQAALNLSLAAGARSEIGLVLHGEELLNPQRLDSSRALTSYGALASFFEGSRPYLARGEYAPLAYFTEGKKTYYGSLNAPVELTLDSSLQASRFNALTTQAVTPLGFDGTIADYITYGVLSSYGEKVRKLVQGMPAAVSDDYFQFNAADGQPLEIGSIIHAPMVPRLSTGTTSTYEIFSDLSPLTTNNPSLYVRGFDDPGDITLGRGEPDSVVLEQLRLQGTYVEAAQSLQSFVAYAWEDPILKYGLLNEALAVDGFNSSKTWLQEFRRLYSNIRIPRSYDFVEALNPALVNNTLFSPVAKDAVVSSYLPLPYVGAPSTDVINLNNTISAGGAIKVSGTLGPFSGNLFNLRIPFFKPQTFPETIKSITSGPLMGDFRVFLDENRNSSFDATEATQVVNQAFYQFNISGRLEQILLDTSSTANKVWTGEDYEVVRQKGIPDFRSGLVITQPLKTGSVVDVMTGLPNPSTYISRAELTIADTHWESVKNSALLDYIPYTFAAVADVDTSRWFDPLNPVSNRTALTKLVPTTLEVAFKASLTLPSGIAESFSSVTRVYDALARAGADPSTAPADLLAQYAFENRVMLVTGLIRRLYEGLTIQRDQLGSPNSADGYSPEIYAYQVLPYLALTLQDQTDPYYRQLLNVIAEAVGTPTYAAAVAAPGYKLNLSNSTDLALVLGFARLTLPHSDLLGFSFSNGRLPIDLSSSITADAIALKGQIAAMKLPAVAAAVQLHMNAVDTVAATQYAANPYLVTTAVSPLKTELLRSSGVLDKAALAIRTNALSHGISSPADPATFTPLTSAEFATITEAILNRSTSTTSVTPAVAGLSRATTVEQTFSATSTNLYTFTLRLSEPAPSGGALFLLNYDGSAEYGSDYTIQGFSNRPEYLHVPAGDTSLSLNVDVSNAENPSSLLIQLSNGSANYEISNRFNRVLLEIDGSNAGGAALLRQQSDNVQSLTSNGVPTLVGENLYDGVPRDSASKQRAVIGTQPALAGSFIEINRYTSSLDPSITYLSSTAPADNTISGQWLLTSKALFRAYPGRQGEVDVVQLLNSSTGRFAYVADPDELEALKTAGWQDQGVVFSLDADRSLPLAIQSNRQKSFDLSVPGFDLSGATGYFDRYIYADNQDISEWRFLADITDLDFDLDGQQFSLGGALALRRREEYGDATFWLSADVDHFEFPSLGTTSTPVQLNDARLAFRIVDPRDEPLAQPTPARIDQWQVAASVTGLPVFDLILNGSLDARYEKSASTGGKETYWLSADIDDFDFTVGDVELNNLDVGIKDLKIVDGQIVGWEISTSVTSLQLSSALEVSGSAKLTYSVSSSGIPTLVGDADISDFTIDLGDTSIDLDGGTIDFELRNNLLRSYSLSADVDNLELGDGLISLDGNLNLTYSTLSNGATSFVGVVTLDQATIAISDDLNLTLDSGRATVNVINNDLRSLTATATIEDADLGFLTVDSASVDLAYTKTLLANSSNEVVNASLKDAAITLDLGSGLPDQQINDVDLTLNTLNGSIVGYSAAASDVSLDLGSGITVDGAFNITHETVVSAGVSSTRTYGTIRASDINVDLPGIEFQSQGLVSFELRNNKLHNLNIFAQVEDLPVGSVDITGFLDLKLSDYIQGAPGKITLSAGVKELALDLPSGATKLSGEVQNLTMVPEYKPFVAAQFTEFGQWTANGSASFDSNLFQNNAGLISKYTLLTGGQNQQSWVVHSQPIPASAWSALVVEFSASITDGADAISFGVFDHATSTTSSGGGSGGSGGATGAAHSVLFDFYQTDEIKVLNSGTQISTLATQVAGGHDWRLEYSGIDRTNLTLRIFRDEALIHTVTGVSVPPTSRLMFGAGSGGVGANASITNLTVKGYGALSGLYTPVGGKLYGSIEDLAIGDLFTADGYAELSYERLAANAAGLTTRENLAGKAEVTEFTLLLPGQTTTQAATITGSLMFDLDNNYTYIDPYAEDPQASTNSKINWFELKAGVSNLTLIDGITLSGSLSLEYQDRLYSKNTQAKSRYIFNVGVRNSTFDIPLTPTQSLSLNLVDASLRDLIVTDDGVVHRWQLKTIVSDLNLFGLVSLSGDLSLDYSRSAGRLSGSATVNDFALDLNADGMPELDGLSGGFSFVLKDDPAITGEKLELSSWNISAQVTDAVLGAFTFDGEVDIAAVYNKNGSIGDTYTINANIEDLTLTFGLQPDGITPNQAILNGELRDLVIVDKREGDSFQESVRSWKLITDMSLTFASFSVTGSSRILYAKPETGAGTTTIKSTISSFTLPTALTQAAAQVFPAPRRLVNNPSTNAFTGSIEATFKGDSSTAELTAWTLQSSVQNLALAGVTVSGSLSLSYSKVTRGSVTNIPYFKLDASFSSLSLSLPGNLAMLLSKGRFTVSFLDTGANSSPLFNGPEELLITATVDQFQISEELSLSGAISLSYAENTYRINASLGSLALPGMPSNANVGGSLSDLVINPNGQILSWTASAYLNSINLYDIVYFTGQASVEYGYSVATDIETIDLSVTTRSLRFVLEDAGVDLSFRGSLNLAIVNDEVDSLKLRADSVSLSIFEFQLNGSLALDYYRQDPTFANLETIRIASATISADFLDGLVDADITISNVIIANGIEGWQAESWSAEADISIGQESGSTLPFSLAGSLNISYARLNTAYSASTLTLSGGVDEFSFSSNLLSLDSASLTLDALVLVDGQVRALDLDAEIQSLKIADLIKLSGDLSIAYATDTGDEVDGTLEVVGTLSDLKVKQGTVYKSLFDLLGITSASLSAVVAGDDLSFTADVNFGTAITKIGDFQFGLDGADATLTYDSSTNDLSLDVGGRILLGNSNPYPVEGSFSLDVDLDTGKPTLRQATLLLTPDNTPLDFGLIEVQPGTSLSYLNTNGENQISLSTDLRINTGFLDTVVTPVYEVINDLAPAIQPIIDTLTATLPIDRMVVPKTDITIPAIKIPEVFISGYRSVWGMRFPIFGIRLKEILPAQTFTILPELDLGKLATNYFEDYAGAAYGNTDKVEMIEVIDKVASQIFYVNQLLARFGIGDAFQPFTSAFGSQALTMDYPALAPFVKTVDTLLTLARSPQPLQDGWLDLDPLAFTFDLDTGDFDLQGGGLDGLIASLGGFGDLYNLVNNNPNTPANQPQPINESVIGFVDRSSMKVPILDNLPKALLDFILDKPIDVFEYNLDLLAGFESRAEIAIPGEATVPLIGIPLPIVIGGNFALTAGVDTTFGFSAPTKGIKQITQEIADAFAGGGLDLDAIGGILFDSLTDIKSGAYLKLDDEMVSLDGTFSADVGLDYKVAGVRGQLGFGATLFGGLGLASAAQQQDRLYLNALLQSLLSPTPPSGSTPADLLLKLKIANPRVFTALQAKAGLSWLTLLRLEGRLPISAGVSIKLGTIYTGPTFGSVAVIFDEDYDFQRDPAEARVFSGFREGTADQENLYDQLISQLLDQDLSGLLIVQPSSDGRDVMTGLSRTLALFDSLSPQDSLPDALTVITSLQSLPVLLQEHQASGSTLEPLQESYLNGIDGFDQLSITAASSYQGLASSDAQTRDLAVAQLRMEYQLQGLLLATADYLKALGVSSLDLSATYPTLPSVNGLTPYLPLALYAQQQADSSATFLDLNDATSLQAYFNFVNTLIAGDTTATASALSSAATLAADLVAAINGRIDTVATAAASLQAPDQAPALALVAIKQLMQSGAVSAWLDSLLDGDATATQLMALVQEALNRPGSSQTELDFAEAGWTLEGSQARLTLSHPASDLGASFSLLIDTTLQYGIDYTLTLQAEGQQPTTPSSRPFALALEAGEQALSLSVNRLTQIAGDIRLILLQGHSGLQVNGQANTLVLPASGSSSIASTSLNQASLSALAAVDLIEVETGGVFRIPAPGTGPMPILLGFDPLQGHRLEWTGSAPSPAPQLQLVNGTLYADNQPLAQVLSPSVDGSDWVPLAYASDSVLRGTTDVSSTSGSLLSLTEDQQSSLSFSSLLAGVSSGSFSVLAVRGDGQLQISRSGSNPSSTLALKPAPDFNGHTSLFVTIDEGSGPRSVRVPVQVAPVADAPRELRSLSFSTAEETPLTLDVADLTSAYLDRDRFDLVEFVQLDEPSPAGAPCDIDFDPTSQTLTITPPAEFNGERNLRLRVAADSGQYTYTVKLQVDAVDDLPTGSLLPALLPNTSAMALTNTAHFKLADPDGPALDPSQDGIRITIYPFAGELLWKETPQASAGPLSLADKRLITLDQLNAGQLLYQHDGILYDNALISDNFTYVVVQDSGTRISAPQTLYLADASKADFNAATYEISLDKVPIRQQLEPTAPLVSGFIASQSDTAFTFVYQFDQALSLEGGSIDVFFAADPSDLNSLQLLTSLASTASGVQLALDGKALTLTLPRSGLSSALQGKEGLLIVDLFSQGDVLRNSTNLSLVGDPGLYTLAVDFKAPTLEGHSFLSKADAMLLELHFSEPVVSSGNVRIELVHPITGELEAVSSSLRPSSTPNPNPGEASAPLSSDVLIDLGPQINSLQMMPGLRYRVVLDQSTALQDQAGNGGTYEEVFDLPFPNTPAFAEASSKALPLPDSQFHLYFSLEKPAQGAAAEVIDIDLQSFGTLDASLGNKPSSLSAIDTQLSSGERYSLGINLYQDPQVGDADLADLLALLDDAEAFELTLRYVRDELWFDPAALTANNLVEIRSTDLAQTNGAGQRLAELRFRFERGDGWQFAPTPDGRGRRLVDLPTIPIPQASSPDLPGSFPSLLLRSAAVELVSGSSLATARKGSGRLSAPEISLPQLIVSKSNVFPSDPQDPLADLLLLGSGSVTLQEDSGAFTALVEGRSSQGLPLTGALSVISQPSLGQFSFDAAKGIWTYKPDPDAYGTDQFQLRLTDAAGRTRDRMVTLMITNINDTPEGSISTSATDGAGGSLGGRALQQGDILSAEGVASLVDRDGLEGVSTSYRWLADGETISGANGSSLTLSQAEVGHTIAVEVSYTDQGGTRETLTSTATAAVLNVNDAPTGRVSIVGAPNKRGAVLTASAAGLSDLDGFTAAAISWSWYSQGPADAAPSPVLDGVGSPITGAALTLEPVLFDALRGRTITVRASYVDAYGAAETGSGAGDTVLTSLPTEPVKAPGVLRLGTSGKDSLLGSDGDDTMQGLQADDTLLGGDGDDQLEGNGGNDSLLGGADADSLSGSDGKDNLSGEAGQDQLSGGANEDRLSGGAGQDQLSGGSHNDTLLGGDGQDRLLGEDGNDLLEGNDGDDRLAGGLGNDTHRGGVGNDTLEGSRGTDLLNGDEGNDSLLGGEDDDALNGGSGRDQLQGEDGNDDLRGDDADDTLQGGNGKDLLIGGLGADLLVGGSGDDTAQWQAYNQSLLNGFDVLIGLQIGSDVLKGPKAVSAAKLRENLGSVASLSESAISALLSSSAFARETAATFTYADPQLGTRTFLALNNDVAGFSAAADAVIEITGFSGDLARLSIS